MIQKWTQFDYLTKIHTCIHTNSYMKEFSLVLRERKSYRKIFLPMIGRMLSANTSASVMVGADTWTRKEYERVVSLRIVMTCLSFFLLKISSSSLLSSFHRHQPKKPLSFFVAKWILYPSNESRPHFLPFMFQASNLLIILSLSLSIYLLYETTSVKNKPPCRTSLSYTCHSPVLSVWDSVQWWETVSHKEHDK